MIQDWQPLLFKEKLKILRYQKLREELGGEHIELQIKGYNIIEIKKEMTGFTFSHCLQSRGWSG